MISLPRVHIFHDMYRTLDLRLGHPWCGGHSCGSIVQLLLPETPMDLESCSLATRQNPKIPKARREKRDEIFRLTDKHS